MERAEAEAICDSGHEACVVFMPTMAQRFEELTQCTDSKMCRHFRRLI